MASIPSGHAGKALRHALSALPHDCSSVLAPPALEDVALTAMSLADRPRPKLVLAPGPLQRHLFAFVWLPREALSTRAARGDPRHAGTRRPGAKVSSWALDLGEGDLALIRYTLDLRAGRRLPDAPRSMRDRSDAARLGAGAWRLKLAETVGAARAARLTLDWAEQFPQDYRTARVPMKRRPICCGCRARYGRIAAVRVRLPRCRRRRGAAADQDLSAGRADPAVRSGAGAREFRLHACSPKCRPALDGGEAGYIHEFLLEAPTRRPSMRLLARAEDRRNGDRGRAGGPGRE
jgi:glutamate dehydrogenase